MTTTPDTRSRRRRSRRRVLFTFVLLIVLGVGAIAAYRAVKPRYRHWKSEKALAEARAYLASRDLAKAELALRVAVDSGAGSEAFDVYADLLETANFPGAVEARRTALKARPGNLAAELTLATTAMRFRDLDTASEALQGCSAADKATPEFRRVAALFAISARQPALADYLLTGLEKENPTDAGTRLLHAAVLLHHPDATKAAAARKELLVLSEVPAQSLAALRVLIDDALVKRDVQGAVDLGRRLQASQGATVNDLLVAADAQVLANPNHRPDPGLAGRIEKEARLSPAGAELYVQWLLVQRRTDDATAWINSLPDNISNSQVAHSLRAAVAIVRSDWAGLRAELAAGAWGPVQATTLQFAFTAGSLNRQGHAVLARTTWASAVAEAQNSGPSLDALVRLARVWRWNDGLRDALYATVRTRPAEAGNYPALVTLLRVGKESTALQEVFGLWRTAVPDLQVAQYNWALLTLLVAPSALPCDAGRKMHELHALDPANPSYATGYALSLLELGKNKEACDVVDALSEADRNVPARAPYLAVIYAINHRYDEARAALKRAPAPRYLLPEESTLLTQAAALCGG